ncbi:hypothetical protein M405DRAFT_899747, partial [Rhizopogon salebrosus TDB-379]
FEPPRRPRPAHPFSRPPEPCPRSPCSYLLHLTCLYLRNPARLRGQLHLPGCWCSGLSLYPRNLYAGTGRRMERDHRYRA